MCLIQVPQEKIETMPAKNYKTGQACIAYEDYQGILKIYYKGNVYPMWDTAEEYFVSKHFAIALSNSRLKLFDNGKMKMLSAKAGTYSIADSLVAFHDNAAKKGFKVYYKGKIKQLEDFCRK